MGLTIFLGLLAASAQFGNSWLGWRVNNIPSPLEPKRRKVYDFLFVLCGLTSVICVGLIAYRSGRIERAHFALDLNSEVQAVAGTPLSMNIFFKDVGTGPAVNTDSYSRAFIEEDESRRSADDAIGKYKVFERSHALGTDNVPKDAPGYYMTALGAMLSDEDVINLVRGIRVLYIMGTIKFKDDFGSHTQYICKTSNGPCRLMWRIGGHVGSGMTRNEDFRPRVAAFRYCGTGVAVIQTDDQMLLAEQCVLNLRRVLLDARKVHSRPDYLRMAEQILLEVQQRDQEILEYLSRDLEQPVAS
jgi:hypothetical protein